MATATEVVAVKRGANKWEVCRSFDGRTVSWIDGTWFVTDAEVAESLDNARRFLATAYGVRRA